MRSRTFQRGSGCFKCSSFGRLTRHTTSDNPKICGPCYELAGFEYVATDNGPEYIADYLTDAVSYHKEIISKGGSYGFGQSPELRVAVLAAIAAEARCAVLASLTVNGRVDVKGILYEMDASSVAAYGDKTKPKQQRLLARIVKAFEAEQAKG